MEFNPTAGIKRSNRLYARILADIDRLVPRGKISPTERRILLELLSRPASTDAEIANALGLDRAQLSRSIKKLLSDGLIDSKVSGSHRAQRLLTLSDEGMFVAAAIDKGRRSSNRVCLSQTLLGGSEYSASSGGFRGSC